MAELDANIADIQEHLSDATVCCICAETFKNPKILPCLHTFCLKCLEDTRLATSRLNLRRTMPCPVCRQEFLIPLGGFAELKNDFKTEKLKEFLSLTKFLSFCDEHKKKQLDIYCLDCKVALCTVCYFDKHQSHKGEDICQAAKGFRQQIQEKIELLDVCMWQASISLQNFSQERDRIIETTSTLEASVVAAKDELSHRITQEANCLTKVLELLSQDKLEEIDSEIKCIRYNSESMEIYRAYCEQILSQGSAAVCQVITEIQTKVHILTKSLDFTKRQAEPLQVAFCRRNLEEILSGGILGEIKESDALEESVPRKFDILEEMRQEINELKNESDTEKTHATNLLSAINELKKEYHKETMETAALKEANKNLIRKTESQETSNAELQATVLKLTEESKQKEISRAIALTILKRLQEDVELERAANSKLQEQICKLSAELKMEKSRNNDLKELTRKHAEEFKLEKQSLSEKIDVLAEKLCVAQLGLNEQQEGAYSPDADFVWDEICEEISSDVDILQFPSQKNSKYSSIAVENEEEIGPTASEFCCVVRSVNIVKTRAAMEEHRSITGVALLYEEVYLTTGSCSTIEVYDADELKLRRCFEIEDIVDPQHMASCVENGCLYILDRKEECNQPAQILKVDRKGGMKKKWSEGVDFGRLSISYQTNIILALFKSAKLVEYSLDGDLIREISLAGAGIIHPLQAIQLNGGTYFVCHGYNNDPLHRVCQVNADGEIMKTFKGKLSSPIVTAAAEDCIIVANTGKCEVIFLSACLEYRGKMCELLPSEVGLRCVSAIDYDISRSVLYLADSEKDESDGRLMAFEIDLLPFNPVETRE